MISLVTQNDYDIWLEIAVEVEPLFGPMVDSQEFQDGIRGCISEKSAYCIRYAAEGIAGIIAINRAQSEIVWLAVRERYRGNRYGDILVKRAIEELGATGDIFVQTFARGIEAGKSARYLYEKNGFIDLRDAGTNPAGLETVIMIRRRSSAL